jgi:hypothetical protein
MHPSKVLQHVTPRQLGPEEESVHQLGMCVADLRRNVSDVAYGYPEGTGSTGKSFEVSGRRHW